MQTAAQYVCYKSIAPLFVKENHLRLGQGTFGSVEVGRHQNKDVAIKKIKFRKFTHKHASF